MDLPQAMIQKNREDIAADPELWTDTVGGRKKRRLYNFGVPQEPDSVMTALPGGSSSTNRLNASGASSAADEEVRQLKEQIEKTRVEMEVREQQLQAELAAWEQAMQAQMTAREQVLKAEMDANMKAFEASQDIFPSPLLVASC